MKRLALSTIFLFCSITFGAGSGTSLTPMNPVLPSNYLAQPPSCNLCFNPYTQGCLCASPGLNSFYEIGSNQQMWWNPYFQMFPTLKPKNYGGSDIYKSKSPLIDSASAHADAVKLGQAADEVTRSTATVTQNHPPCNCKVTSPSGQSPFGSYIPDGTAQKEIDSCHLHHVTNLSGSHKYGADFIESISVDPTTKNLYALTSDISHAVGSEKAMYISKSIDGGKTWVPVAHINSDYFQAELGEGLENHLSVNNGDIVFTTRRGAFEISDPPKVDTTHSNRSGVPDAVVSEIQGGPTFDKDPGSGSGLAQLKKKGDSYFAGDVKINGDHMVVSYHYFLGYPSEIVTYTKKDGVWVKDKELKIKNGKEVLSLLYNNPQDPNSIFVGTADQAFHLDLTKTNTKRGPWTPVNGVRPDAAIHSMATNGKEVCLATCGNLYSSANDPNTMVPIHSQKFAPVNRAYSVDINSKNEMVMTSSKGVFASKDGGAHWVQLGIDKDDATNSLPSTETDSSGRSVPTEYRTAHINDDGSVIVSGTGGTYLLPTFTDKCSSK